MHLLRLAVACFCLLPVVLVTPVAAGPMGVVKKAKDIPASLFPFSAKVEEGVVYPTFDENGTEDGTASWRVVSGTGNCCEVYLAASSSGRLVDLGGELPRYTDDGGRSWSEVTPDPQTTISGEGALLEAPGGDLVGVTWDPYSGDRLLAFKFDASDERWTVSEVVGHVPFYDRPWFAVLSGPFERLGQTYPYATVVKGGWPSKEVWLLSFDGLTYTEMTSKELGSVVDGVVEGPLPVASGSWADFAQPVVDTGITPLGGGRALVSSDSDVRRSCESGLHVLSPSRGWSCYWSPTAPVGRMQLDSKGRLHDVSVDGSAIVYRVSVDGETWKQSSFALPSGYEAAFFDFKVNAAVGVAALVVHALTGSTDRDFMYRFDLSEGVPDLVRIYALGDGDATFVDGVEADTLDCFLYKDCPRMDFSSVAILPDGRIAAGFADRRHPEPAIAIEP